MLGVAAIGLLLLLVAGYARSVGCGSETLAPWMLVVDGLLLSIAASMTLTEIESRRAR
jgi:hypothetical protein